MIGIIGGTGLYNIDGLKIIQKKAVKTPFGTPSAPIAIGKFGNQKVAFLPRHGEQHKISPTEINYRANIWALKTIGVKQVISVSATGSLVKEIKPGSLVLPNQYFDMTKGKREPSFFGNGLVAHVSAAEPVCPCLANNFAAAAKAAGVKLFRDKTYACVEGPRFGTRAESFFLRSVGAHLVGMTNVPEAFLAREAQLCYITVAVATDYDCWMDDPAQHCSVDKVLELYAKALTSVKTSLVTMLERPYKETPCKCGESLTGALLTPEKYLTKKEKQLWAFLKSN
jgi:5'-methylthioadenosine phosphorylase